jgi:hypothetical protein
MAEGYKKAGIEIEREENKTHIQKGERMTKVFSGVFLLFVFLIAGIVSADTIVPCPDCKPFTLDTFPHNGKYGLGTRHFYLHNYWHHDLTVKANGAANGSSWTNQTFTLKVGHDTMIEIPNQWGSARIWGYWDPKYQNGPFTLAEINMDSRTANNWHLDWYDVSLVDGYNLPMLFYPVAGTYAPDDPVLDAKVGRQGWTCGGQKDCVADLYLTAPASMLKLSASGDTNGFYCADEGAGQAACRALKKTACPTSYSWPFDDPTSLFTCPSPNLPASYGDYAKYGPDYIIDFGLPPASPISREVKINRSVFNDMVVTMTRRGEIKYTYGGEVTNARLALFSCSGKLVVQTDIKESCGTVNVPDLARGLYFVKLTAGGSVKSARMMVAR